MKGSFKLIFFIVFSLIALIVDKKIFIIFAEYFSNIKFILLIIAKIIINFFNELSLWITIDRFSPNHTPNFVISWKI